MSTTAVNNFDVVKNSAKFRVLHTDKLVVANGGNPKSGGWKTYTPTLGVGAIGTGSSLWRYKIEGTTLFIVGELIGVNGTQGSGSYTLSFPTGCLARTTSQILGSAYVAGSTIQAVGYAYLYNTSAFQIVYTLTATTTAVWGSGSNADIHLGAASVSAGAALMVELDPASTALAGSF